LNHFWTSEANAGLALTTVAAFPQLAASDGEDIWVGSFGFDAVTRVHAADGRVLQTWTGASNAYGVLSAMGRIFVTSFLGPGRLHRIDPSQPAGVVTTVATNLGGGPLGIAYDGSRIWTANNDGTLSIVTPAAALPWTVTTAVRGANLVGALFDGANIWMTDAGGGGKLLKLDSAGTILQTVTLGGAPFHPIFDGANIWVPNNSLASVAVVRASNGAILATLTGNGLGAPAAAAFDGQRVLVTNSLEGADSVSLWNAADLSPIGSFGTGASTTPFGACSDGINFWITLNSAGQLARF
jgi:DNA-binding beta-propeller fold protein YncE